MIIIILMIIINDNDYIMIIINDNNYIDDNN